ncbi:unnamed protein product [Linum trigynum]|uniref:Uncharacterized protein n=1 Tax=Linum trigynum TaxID=586398 RepID=A0AAV2CS92_9ROSI
MDILRFQFASPGNSFMCLKSLVVQKGRLIEAMFLWELIPGFKGLEELTLEDCSIVGDRIYGTPDGRIQPCPGGRLNIVTRTLMHLRLTRCRKNS